MNAPWCQRCGVSDTLRDNESNECVDKIVCATREMKNIGAKSEDLPAVELRLIADHLGKIRDLLTRGMSDQHERLVAASLGHLLATGMHPIVAARTAKQAADAAVAELDGTAKPPSGARY